MHSLRSPVTRQYLAILLAGWALLWAARLRTGNPDSCPWSLCTPRVRT